MIPTISILTLTVLASATVAANRFVTALGAYPAAGGSAHGVTRSSGVSGDLLPVDVMGTTEVESGGVVTAGSVVMVDATGRVVDQTSTNVKVGRALTGAAAAGTPVEVFLFPNG